MEAAFDRGAAAREPADIALIRDEEFIPTSYIESDPTLNDFYTTTDPFMVLELDKLEYEERVALLSEDEKALLASSKNYYEITFRNEGGLVMPLILQFEYEDGTKEIRRIPAEIWKMSEPTVTKVFVTEQPAAQITLDPMLETADVDMDDITGLPVPSQRALSCSRQSENAAAAVAVKTPCSERAEMRRCSLEGSDHPCRDSHSSSRITSAPKASPHRLRLLSRSPKKRTEAAALSRITPRLFTGITPLRARLILL